MADNVAQSIKDLQKDLSQLDKQLLVTKDGWKELVNTVVNGMEKSGASVKDLYKAVAEKANAKDVLKLRATIQFDRSDIQKQIDELKDALKEGRGVFGLGDITIKDKDAMKSALGELQNQLKIMPKSAAEAYDYIYKLLNTVAGTKKGSEGTAWSRARATEMNAIKNATDEVVRSEKKVLQLEKELEKYKVGSDNWKKKKAAIEEANKQLEIHREKLKLLASRGQSALETKSGTEGFSKEVKQLIQEGRDATREADRLAKVRQKDAEWQEQQRKNTEAQFAANGKAIEQQRKLADQIDILTRKRQALAIATTESTQSFDSRNYPLATAYQKQIDDLIRMRQQLERQFSGSMKAGDLAFADTKTLRDNEELQRRMSAEQKQREKERADAAKQRAAIERKADSESMSNQRRQIQIKAQLSAIDKARNSDRDVFSRRAKAQIAEENAEYKRLSAELTRLIARQKELNAISQGSGSRARGRLQTYEITASEQALRRYEKAWRRVNRAQRESDVNISKMVSNLQRLASAFGVAFSVQGLVQFGKKLVETRGEFEMQFVAMKQIVGDVDAATKIWNQTMQQSLQSPFRAMQLVDYTKKLAAYRIETEKLFDTTKRLADVSAGLGVDMGRLILAYGQVKSANFLRASEVRQFTEAGVNIYGELSNYLSEVNGRLISTAEVAEMVQKRMVSFADVEEIFKRMTDEGGVFFNMQEVQADTVKGQLNKLHDAYDQMLNTIGQAKQGTIRDLIDRLNEMVRNWRTAASFIMKNVNAMVVLLPLITAYRRGAKLNEGVTFRWKEAMEWLSLSFQRNAKYANMTRLQYAKFRLSAMAGTAAVNLFAGAVNIAKTALKTFLPLLAIEGLIYWVTKMQEASRAAKQLEEDLSNIRIENSTRANNEIRNYDKLVKRFNELNQGSLERQEVISKLNSQYGKYIGFQVTETTTLNELAEAQERVNKSLWENARARAEEEQAQRIEQDFLSREQKLLKANKFTGDTMLSYRNERGVYQYLTSQEAKQFSEYIKVQMPTLTSDVLENANAMQDAMKKWVEAFFGVSVKDFGNEETSSMLELMNLYIEEEKRLREEQEKLSGEFAGMDKESLDRLKKVNAEISTLFAELTKAKEGDVVEIPESELDLKIKVPTDLGEKSGVWEAIKEEINKRRDDFVVELKFKAGIISEEERDKLKAQGKETGNLFVDEVNEAIANNILKSSGIQKSLEELKKDIIDNPDQIQDWEAVNHALELTNTHLIKSSDIVNGLSSYTKMLAGNLESGRAAIDDAVRAQSLLVNGTEEEVRKAQDAVDKARERYKWLLRIAKLIGLETKAADEIVAEQGYDLSVGELRKQSAIEAFKKKFGKETNEFGKRLEHTGVTENLKAVADAYHKQSEELKGYIQNQEKALKSEGNLTKAQKEEREQNIENLKVEQQMAEFLATYFGYVEKQKTTGSAEYKDFNALLDVIKKMNSEYAKLSKSAYGYATSAKMVKDSYKEAFDSILGSGAGNLVNWETLDFTSKQGVRNALQELKDNLSDKNLWGKYGKVIKDLQDKLEREIANDDVEIGMDVQVRIREDFGKEIEQMFSDYELTLDLQKINLPSDAAKDILGFDYTSLNSVLERVIKFRNDLENVVVGKDENGNNIIENHFDKEDQQLYANWMKKIEDQLFNIRKERAKQYTKYLEQELSERAKLEMQYVKDVAFVEANFKGEQKDAIKQNLQTNYEQALKEFEWKSFKESDFYVEMMQDLTSMPSEYLDLMMQKLNEWAAKADILSPRALKEVLKAREKVMATQVALSPISALGQSLNVIRGFQDGGRTDAEGKKISKNIKESREQMQGIIVAREQEILKIKEKLALEEQLAGKIKAQEELQESLNQLTNKGVEGLQMTADAAQDLVKIERVSSKYGVILSGLTAGGGVEQMEGEKDADFQTRKQQYEDEVRELRAIIDLLNQLRERRVAASTAGVDPTKDYSAAKMASIKRITDLREQLTEAEREQAKDQGIMTTGYKAWNEAVHGLAKNIKDVTDKAKEMGNQLYDTLEVLGVETDEVSEAWKEFGNSMSDVITSAIEMIPSLVTGFTSAGVAINTAMGVIGLIALAIQAVLSLLSGLSKIHDARLTREIRKQQEYIEDLRNAYERLEKQIEKTWSSVSYIQTYEQQMQNIRDQIDAMNSQMAAERSKKNSDESAVSQYERDIQNAYDQLDELEQKSTEVFGGIGEEGYRSAAEGFVDAWKSAFLETGDGLQGLEDHFDEFLQGWFTKQATMRVAGNMLEPLFRQIDAAVDRYGTGGTDAMLSEIARVREMAAAIFPNLSLALEDLAGMFGVGGEGSLSGLAAGIQGMTEEQANILEAYWNSVRMYTASIDQNVAMIASALGVGGNSPSTNPQLQQLQLIAASVQATHQLLQSTSRSGHPMGGYGFKVFND